MSHIKKSIHVLVVILFLASSPSLFAENELPEFLTYRMTKRYKTYIIDKAVHKIYEDSQKGDPIGNIIGVISDLQKKTPKLKLFLNGEKKPFLSRDLVLVEKTPDGNIFLVSEMAKDLQANDAYMILITIFPKERIVIHSHHQGLWSGIAATHMIGVF